MTISFDNIKALIIQNNFSKSQSQHSIVVQSLKLEKTSLTESVEQAIQLLSLEKFELIISDYRLSDGMVSDIIKQFPQVPHIVLFEKEDEPLLPDNQYPKTINIVKDCQKNYIKFLPEAIRVLYYYRDNEELIEKLKNDLDNRFSELEELKKTVEQLRTENQDYEKANLEISLAIEKAQSIAMEAELENMAKSDFLVRMSQKIRIPMNSIIGYADLLVETARDQTFSSFARKLKYGAERLLSELNTIVDFCKIEAGHINIKDIEFDLEILIHDLISRTTELTEEKNIEVMYSIAPEIPSVLAGDPQRIRQIIMNLLENSVKFTNEGKIDLSLDVVEETENSVKINFTVKDTGIGIKKKKLPKIFEAFKSADDATTKKFGGLGIGLSICQKIVLLLGGEIRVESRFKEGSVFNFHAWFKKHVKQEPVKCKGISLEGRRILILENNMHTLEVLKQMAESFGMVVTGMTSGSEAVSIIEESAREKESFELFIIDLDLSDKDPYEIASGVKSFNIFHPFMLALSNSVADVVSSCRNGGFNGFLPKPTNRKALYNMLKSLIWNRRENRKNEFITQHSIRENLKHSVSLLWVCPESSESAVLKTMLDNSGYENMIKSNSPAALEVLKEKQVAFDMLFLDYQITDYEDLLKEAQDLNIPVVLAAQQQMLQEPPDVAGVKDFIPKPVARSMIYEKVRALVLEKNE